MIGPPFRKLNRLFDINDLTEESSDKFYMPTLRVKIFNALTENKSFFDHPIKNKQKVYQKLVKKSRNDYRIANVLDYLYHHYYYNLIRVDLSRQARVFLKKLIS